MYYRLDINGNIIDCSEEKYSESCLYTDKAIIRAWDGFLYFEGNEPKEIEKSQEEIEAQIQATLTQVVQNALDNFAKTRNYDGILSVCSYANSTNPKFKAEADYCVQLRDDTWAAGYIILDQVKSGFRAIPTAEELIALLPVSSAKWPDEE